MQDFCRQKNKKENCNKKSFYFCINLRLLLLRLLETSVLLHQRHQAPHGYHRHHDRRDTWHPVSSVAAVLLVSVSSDPIRPGPHRNLLGTRHVPCKVFFFDVNL